MRILKATAHFFAAFLLILVSSVGIIALTLSLNLGNREVIASWPVEAGTYNSLTGSLFSLMQRGEDGQESLEDTLKNSLLDTADLETALASVLTPQYWQSKFEGVLNPTYDWLEGATAQPEFVLSFDDIQTPLTKALETEIVSQLKDAPRCPAQFSTERFDVLEATCLPPGVSPAQAADSFTDQFSKTDSPLNETLLTGEELATESPEAPGAYRQTQNWPWQFVIVLTLLVLAVGFTGKSPLYGFRRAGQLMFSSGLLAWIGFYVAQRLSRNFNLPADEAQAELVNELVSPLLRTVTGSVTGTGMWVSLAVMITGILIWLGTFFWHKVHHGDEAKAIAAKAAKQKVADLPKPVKPKG